MGFSLRFWDRKEGGTTAGKPAKQSGPKELPQPVGMHLVVRMKEDPDYVWSLKCVVRSRGDRKSEFDIRVFDPVAADDSGIRIANYDALEAHPELVLFAGWYDKGSGQVNLTKPA